MAISTISTNSLSSTAQIGSLTTASGSAPSYSARAWVNFNGTGTVAIRGSGNVSSITDNGTGDYTVNFTTAMADTNYAMTGSVGNSTGPSTGWQIEQNTSQVASSCRFFVCRQYTPYTTADPAIVNVAVFR